MKNEKIAILPQLNDCKGDLTKKWFVFFSYKDPQSGTMKRFKIYKRLHKCKIKEERYKVAYEIIEYYRQKINN